MRAFSSAWLWIVLLLSTTGVPALAQRRVSFSPRLTVPERSCLSQLIEHGDWRYVPRAEREMQSVVVIRRAHLSRSKRKQYIYIMDHRTFVELLAAQCSLAKTEETAIAESFSTALDLPKPLPC